MFAPFTGIRLFVTLDSGSIMLLLGFENLATNFVYLRMQCQIIYTEGRSHFAVIKVDMLDTFFPTMLWFTVCYLELKLRYLKNLELFSIRVKELFERI